MRTRLRSITHLVRFIGTHEWVYLAALAGFVVGLLPSLLRVSPVVAGFLAAAALLLAILLVLHDTRVLVGRWSAWTMRRRQIPIDFHRSLDVPGLPVVVATRAGSAALDPALDAVLTTATTLIRWSDTPYRLPPSLAAVAPYVLRRSSQGSWPFNGPNVSLATDLTLPAVRSGTELLMRKGDFFSALCSNELTGWIVTRDGEDTRFWDRFVFDAHGRFTSISASELNNGIGVSTLAITTDDMLVVTLQSARSQTSAGLWAPSGSGALEPRDVLTDRPDLVVDAVGRGAERELREETRIPRSAIGGTAVIGYARWLDRGGKPEFSCVTALKVSSSELGRGGQVHTPFSEERLWTAGRELVPLNLSASPDGLRDAHAPGERPPCWRGAGLVRDSDALDDSMSLSLDVALDALARHLATTPHLIDTLRATAHPTTP